MPVEAMLPGVPVLDTGVWPAPTPRWLRREGGRGPHVPRRLVVPAAEFGGCDVSTLRSRADGADDASGRAVTAVEASSPYAPALLSLSSSSEGISVILEETTLESASGSSRYVDGLDGMVNVRRYPKGSP